MKFFNKQKEALVEVSGENSVTMPMKFHKFNNYFLLPLGLVTCLFNMQGIRESILAGATLTWLYVWDVAYYISILVLAGLAFIGFMSWRLYAWRCARIYVWVTVFYNASALLIYLLNAPSMVASTAGMLFLQIGYAVFVTKYYQPRRQFFN